MIRIDGSSGEGGGQILRTSLSLALVTGKAFQIDSIRAGRKRSGLLRQHLAAVLAAKAIGGAELEGDALGSSSLCFTPHAIRSGNYHFSIGTAGSCTLVLQTVLPALITASGPSRIEIEGGTHNMAAPPFEFFSKTFLPLLCRMGPKIQANLESYGFYPAGGGKIVVEIEPCGKLAALELAERSELSKPQGTILLAELPRHIAMREAEMAAKLLGCAAEEIRIERVHNSAGPGNIFLLEVDGGSISTVFSSFGRVGVPAETVAEEVVKQATVYLQSEGVACEYLSDQLLLPLALAGRGVFTTTTLSEHARTNMEVIQKFLPVRFVVEERPNCTQISVASSLS